MKQLGVSPSQQRAAQWLPTGPRRGSVALARPGSDSRPPAWRIAAPGTEPGRVTHSGLSTPLHLPHGDLCAGPVQPVEVPPGQTNTERDLPDAI